MFIFYLGECEVNSTLSHLATTETITTEIATAEIAITPLGTTEIAQLGLQLATATTQITTTQIATTELAANESEKATTRPPTVTSLSGANFEVTESPTQTQTPVTGEQTNPQQQQRNTSMERSANSSAENTVRTDRSGHTTPKENMTVNSVPGKKINIHYNY